MFKKVGLPVDADVYFNIYGGGVTKVAPFVSSTVVFQSL